VSHQPPSDLVELGQVFDAQGLKGHIKVRPYSQDPIALLHCKQIYVQRDGTRGAPIDATYTVTQAKLHSGYVIMVLDGILGVRANLNMSLKTLGIKYLPKFYQIRRRLMTHNTSIKTR